MDSECLCCVDGQEGEVSHRLCLTALIRQLKRRAGPVLVPVVKLCQLQEKWLYASIWSVLTSAAGTQINIGMWTSLCFCLSKGGTWLQERKPSHCWFFKYLIKLGPVARQPWEIPGSNLVLAKKWSSSCHFYTSDFRIKQTRYKQIKYTHKNRLFKCWV